MVTGYDPVAAVTPFPLPAPGSLTRELPAHVEEVISRATRVQPELRFQSMAEFRQALFPPTWGVLPSMEVATLSLAPLAARRQGRAIWICLGFMVALLIGLPIAVVVGGISLPGLFGGTEEQTTTLLPAYQTLSPMPLSSPSPTPTTLSVTPLSATLAQKFIILDNASLIVQQGLWKQEGISALAASSHIPLIAVGVSTNVYLLDANSLIQLEHIPQNSIVHSLAFGPGGQILAVGLSSGKIYLYTLDQVHKVLVLTGHTGSVNDLTLSSDGSLLASASSDNTIRIWDIKAEEVLEELEQDGGNALSVDISPCRSWVAFGTEQGRIGIWSIGERQVTFVLDVSSGPVYDVAFSPDCACFATAAADNTVKLWNPQTGDLLDTLVGHTGSVYALAFNWKGNVLASASTDGTVRLWDVAAGVETRTLVGHEGGVFYVVFGLNSQKMFSAGGDGTVRAWGVP